MALPISRQLKVSIPQSFLTKVADRAFARVSNRLSKLTPRMEASVRELVKKAIQEHPVYKGLNGTFASFGDGSDLQAEFGLTDRMADAATKRLLEILEGTVFVETGLEKTSRTFRISFQAFALDPKDYEEPLRNGKEFSYENKKPPDGPRGKIGWKISWMDWLLDATSRIVDGYGITYVGYSGEGGLSARELTSSRSQRALMTANPKISRNFPWELPLVAIPTGDAKNFIDEIRKNRFFRKIIGDEMNIIIRRELASVLR
jgi:hypothetical protein